MTRRPATLAELQRIRRAHALAAAGLERWQIAARMGLEFKTVTALLRTSIEAVR